MVPNSSTASGGRPPIRYGALSACTVITDMWCATTSCNSRAIRARSSSSVLRSRSASLICSCSASSRCASPRPRTLQPSSSTAPEIATVTAAVSPARSWCRSEATMLAASVTSQTASRVRPRSRSASAGIRNT
ncbi:hypothetical protein ACFQ0T_29635 [Kitasatospora gansuensis]